MRNLVPSLLPDITMAAFGASGSDSKGKDPDKINDPVITASPVNGNGVDDIPDNCEPSPKYVPNDAVDVILPEMFPGIVIFGVAYMYSDCWINPGVYDDVNAICVS
jgi:hypothetical protein